MVKLMAHPEYQDQTWGYLIAYEDAVKRADSWDELRQMSSPVTTE